MADTPPIEGREISPADYKGATNGGKWDGWYKDLEVTDTGVKYGDRTTYLMAGAFLADCEEVEDWGCGRGGFRQYCTGRYVGIDGSQTPYADKVVELGAYRSSVDGVLLRHVVEHNYDWPAVLEAAVASFRRKLCLVIFTPFGDTTRELLYHKKIDVPDLSLAPKDIEAHFSGLKWRLFRDIPCKSQYSIEHVYCVWRP